MVEEQSEEKRKQKEESKAKAAAEKGQFRQEASDRRPANAVATPTSEYEYGYEYYEEGNDNAETPAERQRNNQAQPHEMTDNTGTTPAGPQHPKSEYEYGYEYYGELTGSKKDIGSRDGLEGAAASEGEEYKDDEFDEVEDGVDLQEGDG